MPGNSRHNISEDAFLLLVKAGLFGRTEGAEGLLQEGVDWAEIHQMSKEQRVVGLVAEGIETLQDDWSQTHDSPLVPQKWYTQYVCTTLKLEKNNLAMNSFIASLVSKLQERGISTVQLKGQGMALNYRKPLWRTYGDVDLLFSQEDYEKAREFLLPFASSTDSERGFRKHLGMVLKGKVVELHGSLRRGFSSRIDKKLDEIYDDTLRKNKLRTWMDGEVQVPMLSAENDALFVFVHFLNDYFKGIVMMKPICDWSRLLWSYRDSLDAEYMESQLKAMRLMSEWRAFGRYAVDYMGMPEEAMPFYSDSEKWKRKARRINTLIMRSGAKVYKKKKNEKKVSLLTKKMTATGERICVLAYTSRVFPLDTLCFAPSMLRNGLHQ